MKPEKKSDEASGLQAGSYVYDFLYHDARRVASLLAQFGHYGQLTSVEHSKSTTASAGSKTRMQASGGLPGVASAGGHQDAEAGEKADDAVRAVYDPLWVNALDLYERLDADGFLSRDGGTGMGQFIVATGQLTVLDMSLLKIMMQSSRLRKAPAREGRHRIVPRHGVGIVAADLRDIGQVLALGERSRSTSADL